MLKRAPFELTDTDIQHYIAQYLIKTHSTLLNERSFTLSLSQLLAASMMYYVFSVKSNWLMPLELLQSLYNITLFNEDTKESDEANKIFMGLFKPINTSNDRGEAKLFHYLYEFWQLCQGRLDRLKLDRIGESCEWLGVGDDELYFQRRAKAEERTQLVKQILRDFLQQAIEVTNAELALRQAETAERSTDFPPPSPGLRRQP